MRYILAIAFTAIAGCQSSQDEAILAAKGAQAEVFQQADAKQSLRAFRGTLVGKNHGEWGGKIIFQEPDGRVYTLINDNSGGIFKMSYGVIAFTGLAHLGQNRGSVHLLSRPPGGPVSATLLMRLPGQPCDVVKADDRITMRISSGLKELPGGVLTNSFNCYVLASASELRQYKCPIPEPEICVL